MGTWELTKQHRVFISNHLSTIKSTQEFISQISLQKRRAQWETSVFSLVCSWQQSLNKWWQKEKRQFLHITWTRCMIAGQEPVLNSPSDSAGGARAMADFHCIVLLCAHLQHPSLIELHRHLQSIGATPWLGQEFLMSPMRWLTCSPTGNNPVLSPHIMPVSHCTSTTAGPRKQGQHKTLGQLYSNLCFPTKTDSAIICINSSVTSVLYILPWRQDYYYNQQAIRIMMYCILQNSNSHKKKKLLYISYITE